MKACRVGVRALAGLRKIDQLNCTAFLGFCHREYCNRAAGSAAATARSDVATTARSCCRSPATSSCRASSSRILSVFNFLASITSAMKVQARKAASSRRNSFRLCRSLTTDSMHERRQRCGGRRHFGADVALRRRSTAVRLELSNRRRCRRSVARRQCNAFSLTLFALV